VAENRALKKNGGGEGDNLRDEQRKEGSRLGKKWGSQWETGVRRKVCCGYTSNLCRAGGYKQTGM